MSIDEIKALAKNAAAKPFEIRLTDGRALGVSHPEFVGFPQDEDYFVFFPQEGGLKLVDMAQVVSADIIARPEIS